MCNAHAATLSECGTPLTRCAFRAAVAAMHALNPNTSPAPAVLTAVECQGLRQTSICRRRCGSAAACSVLCAGWRRITAFIVYSSLLRSSVGSLGPI